MLSRTSSRIATVSFQEMLPVDLPEPLIQPIAEPPVLLSGRGRRDPREFTFGILTAFCQPELVDQVVNDLGRQEKRCRLLPARLTVYGLLLMCLSPGLSYQKLMLHLGGLAGALGTWAAPHKSAFVRARERLGWETMESLFHALARPMGDAARDRSCFWRGRRVVALDGTTLELAGNAELELAFGGQIANDGTRQRIGPPRARVVSLVECGTRAILDLEFGHYDSGENSLALSLVRSLSPGMLVLADRGFPSKPLWQAFTTAGVDLLWRAKKSIGKRRIGVLPDGSYLVRFGTGTGLTVRVIEYQIHGSAQIYRLLTNLLDPVSADALELARLYSERWEIEILTNELKTHQLAGRALRSQTEIGVRQELWANAVLHTINRQLVYQAAITTPDRDADRISFTLAYDTIRRSVNQAIVVTRRSMDGLIHRAVRELTALSARLIRRPRSCPRIIYKRAKRYGNRSNHSSPGSAFRPALQIALCRA